MDLTMEMTEERKSTDDFHIADSLQEYKITIKVKSSKMCEEPGLIMITSKPKSTQDNTTHQKKQMAGLLKSLSKDNPIVSCALVIVLMTLVIIILQIPTILYYTTPPSTEDSSLLSSIDFETCTLSNVEVFQSAAPSVSLLEVCITSGCSNDCINNTSPVFHLLQPVYDLSLFTANSQCSEAVVSLFFNAINDDMVNISLDTECIQVRDSSCASEWRITETLFNLTLLDCDSLNATEHISLAKAPILPCPDGYGVLCGSICQPLCAEVSSFSEAATTAYRVLNIIFHGIAIISGIITFVACIYHRKKMFNHPLIFVVYYTVIFQIISYFVVAPYVFGTDSLLCSHPSLVVASADPTAFCKIQGVVIHTGGLIFLGFWLCHLCHVFFSLAYPFRSQQLMKSVQFRKISHLTEVVVVIACGFIPSIAILSTSGYSFTGFPPTCNASDTDVLFYTFTLPYALASTFGLCILLASLWILHKTFKTTSYKEKTSMACANYSTPEAKLMIASLFYVTTNLLILIALAVTLRGINTTLENVTRIALCVAGGDQPECDKYREQLNQHLLPVLVFDLLATSFIALINIVNLLFVLQYKDIKLLTKRVSRLLSTSGVY